MSDNESDDIKELPKHIESKIKRDAQSAMSSIFDIVDILSLMQKQIEVIDSNIKLLNNKLAKMNKIYLAKFENYNFSQESKSSISAKPTDLVIKSGKERADLIIGKTRVYGKILNRNKTPIQGVKVLIMDNDGDILKTRQTDKEGFWETRLPSGDYVVEYTSKQFKPVQLKINITNDMTQYEVK